MSKILTTLISNIRTVAAIAASKVLEETVFPWYEAKTGKYTNDRTLRKSVAEQLESNLSSALWVLRDEVEKSGGLPDLGDYALYTVLKVFPQAVGLGEYDLKVVVYCKDIPSQEPVTCSLEEFLRSFIPYQEVSFSDLDS